MPGLTEVQAGRLWAKAFTNKTSRENLEKDPRAEAKTIFTLALTDPLLDTSRPGSYSQFFYAKLNSDFTLAEQQNIRDTDIDVLIAAAPTAQKKNNLKQLKATLIGNVFEFFDSGGTLLGSVEQYIDGPQAPDLPLTRNQWIRIYARAHLTPAFKTALELDPQKAIDSLPASFGLGHTAGTPIFFVPTEIELWEELPANHPLRRNFPQLRQVLVDIAAGVPPSPLCTCELMVNLSC